MHVTKTERHLCTLYPVLQGAGTAGAAYQGTLVWASLAHTRCACCTGCWCQPRWKGFALATNPPAAGEAGTSPAARLSGLCSGLLWLCTWARTISPWLGQASCFNTSQREVHLQEQEWCCSMKGRHGEGCNFLFASKLYDFLYSVTCLALLASSILGGNKCLQ